jgi:hypothetical protein
VIAIRDDDAEQAPVLVVEDGAERPLGDQPQS